MFYQEIGGSRFSGGATSNTDWTLAGLTLGKTYDFFVVAYGGMGVLPSTHSNLAVIVFSELHLKHRSDLISCVCT